MKKILALLMGILLMVSVALAEGNPGTIQSMSDLGEIRRKLDEGITIEMVYFTNGYGFSTSEFMTEDPDEIARLWDAVNAIVVGDPVDEFITDWYPMIWFYLSDGTEGGVGFESEWLSFGGKNYEISNAEAFWNLTAELVEKYEQMRAGAVPDGGNEVLDGGWGAASDPTITDHVRELFEKGMEGLVGVDYVPIAYLGSQVVAGYNHAVLCQAVTVYPGSQPRWVIVYLYEDLEGGVSVTDIADLQW